MQRTTFVIAVAAGLLAIAPVLARPASGDVPAIYRKVVPLQLDAGRIKDLQTKLDRQGFSPGKIDGLWGPNTSEALRRLQAARGLQASGRFDQQTLALLDAADTPASSSATLVAPPGAVTPGRGGSVATDRAPSSVSGGVQPGTSGAGMAAAGGDTNQAVATTDANAPQPAHGANSFSKGEAERRITGHGFQDVGDLHKDGTGVWRGTATKGGQRVQVWLDYKGNVGQ